MECDFVNEQTEKLQKQYPKHDIFKLREQYHVYTEAENIVFKEIGMKCVDDCMRNISYYLTTADFDECLKADNYFLYVLALLDRRLGKRRLKEIVKRMEEEPEWLKRFIYLRAEAEQIKV